MSFDDTAERLGQTTIVVFISPVTLAIWLARQVWALRSREALPVELSEELPPTRQQLAEAAKRNLEESLQTLDSLPLDSMEKEALRGHARRQMIKRLRELMQ